MDRGEDVKFFSRKRKHPEGKLENNSLSLSEMRKKRVSPLNDVVWRSTLYIAAGCLAAWLMRTSFGFDSAISIWITAIISLATWIFAIRMLLLDSRFKKLWIIWLGSSVIFIAAYPSSAGMWITAVSFAFNTASLRFSCLISVFKYCSCGVISCCISMGLRYPK